MSTERKPGSRGVLAPSTGERANQPPRDRVDQLPRSEGKKKGSTKTASPKSAFKKRKRK